MSETTKSVFVWDLNKYTTKVSAMDSEHEGLVKIMNQLYDLNSKGTAKAQLLKTIELLAQKTIEHFAHEETYFSALPGYDKAPSHKIIHKRLLDQFTEHLENFRKSPSATLGEEFFLFLKVWLQGHICGIDQKYGEF